MNIRMIESLIMNKMSGMTAPDILLYDEITSTNDVLGQMAADDLQLKEGTIVAALSQTKGKGRRGRSFFSPDNAGLYFSILLKPQIPFEEALIITPMAAVAVYESIKELFGIELSIKWVNDLYCENRKICGILAESDVKVIEGIIYPKYVILGMGINLFDTGAYVPDDIADKYGTLFGMKDSRLANSYAQKGREYVIADLIDKLYEKITFHYGKLAERNFMSTYRSASMLTGKKVSYVSGNLKKELMVLDIDNDGALICRDNSGEIKAYRDGEINLTGWSL